MPFLAPLAAPLIIGGATAGGMLGASALASKKSASQKAQEQAATEATKAQLEIAKAQEERSAADYAKASPIYDSLIGKYKSATEKPFTAASGAIEEAARNTYNMENLIRQQGMRGGGAELAMAQARLGLGQQAASLTNQAREEGYTNLGRIANELSGRAATGASGAAGTYGSLLPYGQQQNNGAAQALSGVGNVAGQALMQWLNSRSVTPTSTIPGGTYGATFNSATAPAVAGASWNPWAYTGRPRL